MARLTVEDEIEDKCIGMGL